jgi:hypothetical protein
VMMVCVSVCVSAAAAVSELSVSACMMCVCPHTHRRCPSPRGQS